MTTLDFTMEIACVEQVIDNEIKQGLPCFRGPKKD